MRFLQIVQAKEFEGTCFDMHTAAGARAAFDDSMTHRGFSTNQFIGPARAWPTLYPSFAEYTSNLPCERLD